MRPLVSANGNHTCAITEFGEVKCWGNNQYGQLGLGNTNHMGGSPSTSTSILPKIELGTGRRAVSLSTGFFHTCAILDNGSLKCWGRNDDGQLGLEDTDNRGDGGGEMGDALPAIFLGAGKTAVQVAAGYSHTCALLNDGAVKCWGANSTGVLGLGDELARGTNNTDGSMHTLPAVNLGVGRTAQQMSTNAGHTCVLLDNASIKCWGNNFYGQLGLGDWSHRGDNAGEMGDALPAVDLGTGRTASQVMTGGGYSCALLDNGQVKCWGQNSWGDVIRGSLGTCWALDMNDQSGACWNAAFPIATRGHGLAAGQMGDALPAVDLGSGRTAVALSLGNFHACALLDNGAMKCWGENDFGQLGLLDVVRRGVAPNQMGDHLPAIAFGAGQRAVQISAGKDHTCARVSDFLLKCWGANSFGQLGIDNLNHQGDGAADAATFTAATGINLGN